MPSNTILAGDLGKTGCRLTLHVGARRFDASGAGSPGLAARDGANLAEAAILALSGELLRCASIDRVYATCIGAAGALAAPDAASHLARLLCESLPSDNVVVASDATTSHAGALSGAPGLVLAAGTGAVALAIGTDGILHRADGWGPRLGDEGGGAWIGMSGLRAALRAHDGRGQPSMLCHSAAARFGKLEALPALIEGHENPARLAATFAGDVYRDAVSGDPVAYGLIQAASRHMAETAIAAGMRLGSNQSLRFAAIGGLLNLGTLLTDPLHDAIRQALPWLQFGDANGTSLDGAFLLATDRGTVHESSLARHQPHQEGETLPP